MIKNEIQARIILTFFTILPIYLAVGYFQSDKPFVAVSMLLISVLFLITQVNINRFLTSEKKPKPKLMALQIFISVISLALLAAKLLGYT